MGLRNPKRFGLDVNKEFADTQDKNLSLRNLNLPIFDLNTIRGSSAAGGDRDDFASFLVSMFLFIKQREDLVMTLLFLLVNWMIEQGLKEYYLEI